MINEEKEILSQMRECCEIIKQEKKKLKELQWKLNQFYGEKHIKREQEQRKGRGK